MPGSDENRIVLRDVTGDELQLTKEQASCVNFKGDRTQLVVKGSAGSGKSVVLMTKALKLIKEMEPGQKNGILMLTYTNSLVAYMKEKLDRDGVNQDFIRITTIDAFTSEIYKSMRRRSDGTAYPDHPGRIVFSKDQESAIRSVLQARARLQTEHVHRFYRFDGKNTLENSVQFWIKEIEWMQGLGFTKNDEEAYLSTPRRGRNHTRNMTKRDREEAFQIYCDYIDRLRNKGTCDWAMTKIFINKHRDDVQDSFRYDHVLIDEAQDLSLVEMQIAIGVAKKDVLVAMDANQRLYRHHWLMKDIGIPMSSRNLKKSFRCTRQIDQFAEPLRRINEHYLDDDDCASSHVIPDADGTKPLVVRAGNKDQENNVVIGFVRKLLENPKTTTAILVFTKREQSVWQSLLASEGIASTVVRKQAYSTDEGDDDDEQVQGLVNITTPGVKILTMHSSKGLEFHNVIIPRFDKHNYPRLKNKIVNEFKTEDDWKADFRNLVYVAMTRARYGLIITFYDRPSIYLDEINSACPVFKQDDEDRGLYRYLDLTREQSESEVLRKSVGSVVINAAGTTASPEQYRMMLLEGDEAIDSEAVLLKEQSEFNSLVVKAAVDSHSMYLLGKCYEIGRGTMPDRMKALECYRDAAERGDVSAQYAYGLELVRGTIFDNDVSTGLGWIEKAALSNSVDAELFLAKVNSEGKLCPKNMAESFRWSQMAANNGDSDSQLIVAKESLNGPGGQSIQEREYEYWLNKAAYGGNAEAQYLLGKLKSQHQELDEAFSMFLRSARAGLVEAQFEVSRCFERGQGTDKDVDAAVSWLKKSASAGYSYAQYELSKYYGSGIGVTINHDLEYEYLVKAANQGLSEAIDKKQELDILRDSQSKACTIFVKNNSFPLDCEVRNNPGLYFDIFKTFAERGYPDAEFNLAICYLEGVGVEQNPLKFQEHLLHSAESGCSTAMFALYQCLNQGIGMARDKKRAYEKLIKAAKMGCTEAYSAILNTQAIKKTPSDKTYLIGKIAKSGYVDGFYEYGWALEMKHGLRKADYPHAKYWYQKYYEATGEIRGKRALERLDQFAASDKFNGTYTDDSYLVFVDIEASQQKPREEDSLKPQKVLKESSGKVTNVTEVTTQVNRKESSTLNPKSITICEDESHNPKDLADFFVENGITIRDNRSEGKSLWVRGNEVLPSLLPKIKEYGYDLDVGARGDKMNSNSQWFKVIKRGD